MCVSVSLCLCVRVYNRCVYCPLLLLLQLLLLLIALNCCCCCCCGTAASSRRQRCCCSYVFLRLHTNILLPVLYTHTHTGAAVPKLHSLSPRSCPLASLASPLTSMISVVAAPDDDGDADDGNGNGDVNSNGFQLFSCQVQRGGEGGS